MAARHRIIEHEWNSDPKPLPGKTDFDPWGNDLDAQCAWENFGGLSRIKAFERFQENPCYYQEDFMFMGGVAFAYYYPVIERFLLEAEESDEPDDREAWILAHCISNQLRTSRSNISRLEPRILALAQHVRTNLACYSAEETEQSRIDTAWREVETWLASPQA